MIVLSLFDEARAHVMLSASLADHRVGRIIFVEAAQDSERYLILDGHNMVGTIFSYYSNVKSILPKMSYAKIGINCPQNLLTFPR